MKAVEREQDRGTLNCGQSTTDIKLLPEPIQTKTHLEGKMI